MIVSHTGVRYLNLQIESIKHPSQHVSPGTVWSFHFFFLKHFFISSHHSLADSKAGMYMLRGITLLQIYFIVVFDREQQPTSV